MKTEYFKNKDWWWKESTTGICYKFQHEDYLNKIDYLHNMISEKDNENKRLREMLDKAKQRNIINEYI